MWTPVLVMAPLCYLLVIFWCLRPLDGDAPDAIGSEYIKTDKREGESDEH